MPSKTILIIEDDDDIRELLKLAVEIEGYTVYTAINGRDGLDRLTQIEKPCLILLDLMMPIMDGWAFAEELEKNADLNTIPYIIVSAFAESAGNIKKARAVLKKPIELELLKETLSSFCRT